MDNGSNNVMHTAEMKKKGCWSKFKSLFEDRGFDLEYEYNDTRSTTVLKENSEVDGNKRSETVQQPNSISNSKDHDTMLDGELSGVINFYEQFATLGDEAKEEELWRKSSGFKHRVSMRPSWHLTNIMEETSSLGDSELYETELVSCFKLSKATGDILKINRQFKYLHQPFINYYTDNHKLN